jgi:hypothetical protein
MRPSNGDSQFDFLKSVSRLPLISGDRHLVAPSQSNGYPRRLSAYGNCKPQLLALICFLILHCACGGGGGTSNSGSSSTITSIAINSNGTSIIVGQTLILTASVQGTGSFNSQVTWAVNGVTNGNSQYGTINGGSYVAPAAVPSTDPVTVTATSIQDSSKFVVPPLRTFPSQRPARAGGDAPKSNPAGDQGVGN